MRPALSDYLHLASGKVREIYRIDVAAVIIRDLERRARLRDVYRGTLDPEAAGVA